VSKTQDDGKNRWFADSEGKETVDKWECVEGCPAREFPDTTTGIRNKRTTEHAGGHGRTMGTGWDGTTDSIGFGDSGTASRFFKQVQEDK
jgi:hypothetical protein